MTQRFAFRAVPRVLFLLAAAAFAPAAPGFAADEQVLAQIPERIREFVADHQISGAVTLVTDDGRVVHHEAVGHADLENDRPMRKDSIFGIASMTKPITATAVMILQDDGKLSIDDPVARYIPEFKNVTLRNGQPPTREITLRDLLTHTSGLGGSQQNQGTLRETVEQLARRPLEFEPGTKWQYSPGLTVCGRVIEVVSGQPYEEFLAARIFQPLGMRDTSFHPTPDQQRRIVTLYEPGEDGRSLKAASHWLTELSEDRTPNPSGGLFSTAADMGRFYQAILNGGELDGKRIVSESSVREMTRVQTGDLTTGFTPGNGWGLGWCVVHEPQGVTAMLSPGSFGHGGLFGTQGWIDPQRRMIFVLLIQRANFGNSDASDIRRVFQDLAVKAVNQ